MTLHKLQIFQTIYEAGSTSNAAEKLHVTRSAVSQALAKLEHELGVSLFTRLPRGLVATPSGHQLAQNMAPLLQQMQEEIEAVSQNHIRKSCVLNIGAPQTTGTIHMPRILQLFHQKYRDVEIRLTLDRSPELVTKVLQGYLDFSLIDFYGGVTLHRDLHAQCLQQPVLEEVVVMVCSPDYYEQKIAGDLSYENLITLDYVSFDHEYLEFKSWFYVQFGKSPKYFRRKLLINNGLAVFDCACKGLGLCMTGSNISQDYVEKGDLVEITPHVRGQENHISLIQLLDKKPSAMEKALRQHIQDYARRLWKSGV